MLGFCKLLLLLFIAFQLIDNSNATYSTFVSWSSYTSPTCSNQISTFVIAVTEACTNYGDGSYYTNALNATHYINLFDCNDDCSLCEYGEIFLLNTCVMETEPIGGNSSLEISIAPGGFQESYSNTGGAFIAYYGPDPKCTENGFQELDIFNEGYCTPYTNTSYESIECTSDGSKAMLKLCPDSTCTSSSGEVADEEVVNKCMYSDLFGGYIRYFCNSADLQSPSFTSSNNANSKQISILLIAFIVAFLASFFYH